VKKIGLIFLESWAFMIVHVTKF